MKHTYKTAYKTRRLKNSVNGNPRYELSTLDGLVIGSTHPDSSIAYGPVPNYEGRECEISVHETDSGRRYIENVKPIA
jgi:hypothetical protein